MGLPDGSPDGALPEAESFRDQGLRQVVESRWAIAESDA
jgi:hypothetical protein